mmetsp:Transcript_149111/g.415589  ORF Transcript_149111/g.415589 Transcript_149111/m.415589 type:complete len:286 (+) Transcript_149111:133-990(+)
MASKSPWSSAARRLQPSRSNRIRKPSSVETEKRSVMPGPSARRLAKELPEWRQMVNPRYPLSSAQRQEAKTKSLGTPRKTTLLTNGLPFRAVSKAKEALRIGSPHTSLTIIVLLLVLLGNSVGTNKLHTLPSGTTSSEDKCDPTAKNWEADAGARWRSEGGALAVAGVRRWATGDCADDSRSTAHACSRELGRAKLWLSAAMTSWADWAGLKWRVDVGAARLCEGGAQADAEVASRAAGERTGVSGFATRACSRKLWLSAATQKTVPTRNMTAPAARSSSGLLSD